MSVRVDTQVEPIAGYRLMDRLGSGGFGEVWKCEAPGGIFKAVKIIHGDLRNRETDAYRFAEQELKSLKRVKQVRHPYLLALDRFDIVEGRLMIVMELADCNLWDRFRECRKQGLPGIPRDELLRYMTETAEVLDLMNDKFQLQHLDIKPQNLFLLFGHVKVADFGQVKDLEGMVASVTGGITPVYAAPETFDGFVSRFCDQYSLACVYQELLTGERPFDGTSMQHLLVQHLQQPPNLSPSPPSDRPALARALAKKPDDRFPNIMAMVNAIRTGISDTGTFAALKTYPPGSIPGFDTPPSAAQAAAAAVSALTGMPVEESGRRTDESGWAPDTGDVPPSVMPRPSLAPDFTPFPDESVDAPQEPERTAPPEALGSGPLRPALVIGVGFTGQRVLQRLNKQLVDRYGEVGRIPAIRTLYIDTDPDALSAATADQPWAGLSGLPAECVVPAKLNRATHYIKPRINGRNLLEGWLDPQVLYKLPRTQLTSGYRVFGRLAFCDNYRHVMPRIAAELDAALAPTAMSATQDVTGLESATNRPRVYVVAGLGGGTGAGMFLDLAYAVRSWLRRAGYANPDVVGVLLVPPDGPPHATDAQTQANTYAALTELHHYSQPTTTFVANYDDRGGLLRDPAPPFNQVYLLPGLSPTPVTPVGSGVMPVSAANRGPSGPARNSPRRLSGSTPNSNRSTTVSNGAVPRVSTQVDPTIAAADFLRLDMLSMVGRLVSDVRAESRIGEGGSHVRTFGLSRFTWPRAELVNRATRVIAPVLLAHWVSPDPARVRDVIPRWAADLWERVELAPDQILVRMTDAGDEGVGTPVSTTIAGIVDPLIPKGWLAKSPDADKLSAALTQMQTLLGPPPGVLAKNAGRLDEALAEATSPTADAALADLETVLPGLIENPAFRVAGAEEAIRQLVVLLDKGRTKLDQQARDCETAAASAYEHLMTAVHAARGGRKTSANDLVEALRSYPKARHQALVARASLVVYRRVRDHLTTVLADVVACRQRVEGYAPALRTDADIAAASPGPDDLLPSGCFTTEDAAQLFLKSLTDDDLTALDARVQKRLEEAYGGLYQACLNSAAGKDGVLGHLRAETWQYLNDRLGDVDMAGMFFARYGTGAAADQVLTAAYDAAAPGLLGRGPWAAAAITAFAGPFGAGGDPVRDRAAVVLPEGTIDAESVDEVAVYREYPDVPIAALPQLGPSWSTAYQHAADLTQVTPHSRLDVTQWVDVDSV